MTFTTETKALAIRPPRDRVLLVKKHHELMQLLVEPLSKLGYEADLATDIHEALRFLVGNSNRYHAVISGLLFESQADGITLFKILKSKNNFGIGIRILWSNMVGTSIFHACLDGKGVVPGEDFITFASDATGLQEFVDMFAQLSRGELV